MLVKQFGKNKSYRMESRNGIIISIQTNDNDIIQWAKTKGLK